jgi:uncharacterized protein with ATP-grasp and redox domains
VDPLYRLNAFEIRDDKICLTSEGRKYFEEIVKRNGSDEKFKTFLGTLKLIREICDKLSIDELLLLVYLTYPEFTEKSDAYEKLLFKKNKIAKKLLEEGLITERRYIR